ncbi:hypothetical protein BDQ17DRAFT_1326729 [Cyathus striatus]|nr:hypothetical protein BDQ17DRAFT_1326729 [Cyathus striatus]
MILSVRSWEIMVLSTRLLALVQHRRSVEPFGAPYNDTKPTNPRVHRPFGAPYNDTYQAFSSIDHASKTPIQQTVQELNRVLAVALRNSGLTVLKIFGSKFYQDRQIWNFWHVILRLKLRCINIHMLENDLFLPDARTIADEEGNIELSSDVDRA